MGKLSDEETKQRLNQLTGWQVDNGSLNKDFKFADFKQAFNFMSQVAKEAEKLNHHPDWSNSYNKVSISLTTHSVGGLSDKDFALARYIDNVSKDLN